MTRQEQQDIYRKLKVLKYAEAITNVSKACRYFGISRETFYQWKKSYKQKGEVGLINSNPCPANPKLRTPVWIEEKILYLRQNYHLGQQRIAWYLKRYHELISLLVGVIAFLREMGLTDFLPINRNVLLNLLSVMKIRYLDIESK